MNRVLFISLLLAFAAYGQQERIAIMNTVDDRDSIDFYDLSYLTDKLRDIAGKILPKSRYGIMTQQSIVDRLGSQDRMVKECKAATCLADLGRKISADYIAQGHVGRFSGKLTIKVELYLVRNSNLIGSFTGDSRDLDGLLAVLEAKAPKLFEDMPGVSDVEEKKAVALPVPVPVPEMPLPPVIPVPQPVVSAVPKPPAVPSAESLKDAVDVELGYKAPKSIDPQVDMEEFKSSSTSFWVALALDITGALLISYGLIKYSEASTMYSDYSILGSRATRSDFNDAWKKVEEADSEKNTYFALGGLLLAAGIGVHIWF